MTAQQFSQFKGRRLNRPLRGIRSAALEAGMPKFGIVLDDIGSLSLTGEGRGEGVINSAPSPSHPSDGALPLPLGRGFKETWLEIGFGSGEHLAAQAQRHPDIGFIGVEPYVNGVSALLKTLDDHKIENVRVFTDDARFLLKALPDASIGRCFILFADPWPKKRHHKRRIVNADTLTDLARALKPDGEIYLATDDPGLAEWYEETIAANPDFELKPASGITAKYPPADWPATRYEEKALAKGLNPNYYKVIRRL